MPKYKKIDLTLKLTITQRFLLLNVVRLARGGNPVLYRVVKLLDVLELTEEEEEEIGYEVLPNGNTRWDDDADERVTWTLKIDSRKGMRFLQEQVDGFTGWVGAQARETQKLYELLGIPWPDLDDEDEEDEEADDE